MSGRAGAKIMALLVAAVLVLYLVATFGMAAALIQAGDLIAKILGLALIIFPILGGVLILREIMFGMQAERLLEKMISENALPKDTLPKRPSGRPDRSAADHEFPRWKAEVEQQPDDWRAWYRLALAYRASGDTGRSRAAVREAIRLERK